MDAFQSSSIDAFSSGGRSWGAAPLAHGAAVQTHARRLATPAVAVVSAVRGLGADQAAAPPLPAAPVASSTGMLWGALLLGGIGFLSYQIGAAMSPNAAKRTMWGWIAVPTGLLTGPIGLGVMALVSNHERTV